MSSTFEIAASFVVQDREIGMMPGVILAPNGDLLVSYNTSIDRIAGGEVHMTRSPNLGQTWEVPTTVAKSQFSDGCVHHTVGMTALSDGRILIPYNDGLGDPWKHGAAPVKLCLIESETNGRDWSDERVISTDLLEPYCYGKIIELKSGRLLMPVWGRESEDDVRRSGVLASNDGGRTWGQYATIAYDAQPGQFDAEGSFTRKGGYNETTIVELPSGEILAILRQSFVGGDEFLHLFRSTSSDQGATWTAPEKLEICGTSPSVHVTTQGKILLGYRTHVHEPSGYTERGQPLMRTDGVAVSWSDDDGRTWQGPLRLLDPKGHQYIREYEAGYPAMVNLPSGETLAVFYSYDDALVIPASFPEPYKFYIAANVIRAVN